MKLSFMRRRTTAIYDCSPDPKGVHGVFWRGGAGVWLAPIFQPIHASISRKKCQSSTNGQYPNAKFELKYEEIIL